MRSLLRKLRRKETGLVLIALPLIFSFWFLKPRPIRFETLQDLTDFAVASGYKIEHSGQGYLTDNCYISDHPVPMTDLLLLTKRDCGLTSAWRGIIWACSRCDMCCISPATIGGKWRIWGNVLVAGDEHLMDEVEQRYRHS
jgi:hypothetical protein